MTTKADFNADEWATVVEAPLLAGVRVVAAERGGTIRETIAISKVYSAARQSHGENALLDELAASPPAIDQQKLQSNAGDPARASSERLRAARAIPNEKGAPEGVEAYKTFVLSVARAAAEAHKEGGFIGIGGRRVSPGEQAALDDLRSTLDAS